MPQPAPQKLSDDEIAFMDAAASDVLEHLPPLSQEEYDYYMALLDKE